jgi:hypothetical protein
MPEPSSTPIAYISTKWRGVYETLCKGDTAIFEQMGSLFTLCATIGHLLGESKTPEKRDALFRWSTLRSEIDVPILTAVAWDSLGRNMAILTQEREIVEICCGFAESGMSYLYENFFEEFMENGQLEFPKSFNFEFALAQVVEGLRKQNSIF